MVLPKNSILSVFIGHNVILFQQLFQRNDLHSESRLSFYHFRRKKEETKRRKAEKTAMQRVHTLTVGVAILCPYAHGRVCVCAHVQVERRHTHRPAPKEMT